MNGEHTHIHTPTHTYAHIRTPPPSQTDRQAQTQTHKRAHKTPTIKLPRVGDMARSDEPDFLCASLTTLTGLGGATAATSIASGAGGQLSAVNMATRYASAARSCPVTAAWADRLLTLATEDESLSASPVLARGPRDSNWPAIMAVMTGSVEGISCRTRAAACLNDTYALRF